MVSGFALGKYPLSNHYRRFRPLEPMVRHSLDILMEEKLVHVRIAPANSLHHS
jgi:hypothetical protein